MAGLVNQLPGVWVGKETGFIPRLQDLGADSEQTWDDAQLAALVDAVNDFLGSARWERRATAAGARDHAAATGSTGYAGFIRYVWSLDEAPDGRHPVVVGDQTPNYVLALPYLEHLFPDARYLHVVRDPRDVVASILPLGFGADSAAVAASDWNECVAGWWAAERRVPPDRRCEVRYEDLVSDPQVTLERLAEFLDTAPPGPDAAESLRVDVHGLARLAPHHQRLGLPIDDRSIGRHQHDLSARDRSLVEAITYAGLLSYGYEVGPYRPSPVLEENALLRTRGHLQDLRRRSARAVARRLTRWR